MGRGRPSHLEGVVRLAAAGIRRRRTGGSLTQLRPQRKLAVERSGMEVTAAELRRYLAATRGAELYPGLAPESIISPSFSAVWETPLVLQLLAAEGMPFPSGGIVHIASELVVVRPLRLADWIRCRLEFDRLEPHPRGSVLRLECRSWNGAGQLCQENATRLLIRHPSGEPGNRSRADAPEDGQPEPLEDPDWRELATWSVPADAGVRYARASGDFNPIHLWSWSSRLLGFTRPILHGHCSLAMIAHELMRLTGRSPRRVDLRFRAPLELPGQVRLEVSGDLDSGSARVRLVDRVGEGKAYVEGSWVG